LTIRHYSRAILETQADSGKADRRFRSQPNLHRGRRSSALHEANDLQPVAGRDAGLGIGRALQDLSVVLDRHDAGVQTELLEQGRHRRPLGHLAPLAVHLDLEQAVTSPSPIPGIASPLPLS
jgi:hypothetical protein